MLFLGAGASKPLGIPTMEGFTDVVIQDVKGKGTGFEQIIRSIQSQVSKFGLKPDIEAILTVIQGKSKPITTLEDLAFSAIQYPESLKEVTPQNVDDVVRFLIEDAIYQRCLQINHAAAILLMGLLWDGLYSNLVIPSSRNSFEGLGGGSLLKIFTTNYDLAVETFLKSRNYGYDDGFRRDDVGDNAFDGNWTEGRVNLFKLHGSVNYFEKADGKVVSSEAQLDKTDLYGRQVKGRRMIYPTGDKYATRSPFFEYLVQLRQALKTERVCIVIGYSFRDVPVNNAFLDGVQKNPRLRILIVSPSADRVTAGLNEELKRNVLALNGEFGNNLLPQSILERFKTWPWPWPQG